MTFINSSSIINSSSRSVMSSSSSSNNIMIVILVVVAASSLPFSFQTTLVVFSQLLRAVGSMGMMTIEVGLQYLKKLMI